MSKDNSGQPGIPASGAFVAEIARIAAASIRPIQVDDREPQVLVPTGFDLRTLPPEAEPKLNSFITERVTIKTTDSFIKYVKRFQLPDTTLFFHAPSYDAIIAGEVPTILAVIDYHGAPNTAGRISHTVRLEMPLSYELKKWLGMNGKMVPQMEFVEFIEQRKGEILEPDNATLMEVVRTFEATTGGKFFDKVDRVLGGRKFIYNEDVNAVATVGGQEVTVPDAMKIFIPIFHGGARNTLHLRLAFTPSSGSLKVAYHIIGIHVELEASLKDIRTVISSALDGIPVLDGTATLDA